MVMKTQKQNLLPELDLMGLILVVWLCALPFIGLLIVPLFGVKAAVVVAVMLLIAMLVYCWGNCIPQVVAFYREKLRGRERRQL
jgi:hypothetical protein